MIWISKVDWFKFIMVIVYRLNKWVVFILCIKKVIVNKGIQVFFNN